jgi:hypothetical protein
MGEHRLGDDPVPLLVVVPGKDFPETTFTGRPDQGGLRMDDIVFVVQGIQKSLVGPPAQSCVEYHLLIRWQVHDHEPGAHRGNFLIEGLDHSPTQVLFFALFLENDPFQKPAILPARFQVDNSGQKSAGLPPGRLEIGGIVEVFVGAFSILEIILAAVD